MRFPTIVFLLICLLLSTIDAEECGKRNINPTLITGGQDAIRGEFPWHVGFYARLNNGTYAYFCAGTLIRTNIFITAAHCVYSQSTGTSIDAARIKVALGKHNRDYNEDPTNSGVQVVDVESISIHKRYRGRVHNFNNDIAVLKLASHVKLTRAVNVACVDLNLDSEESVFSPGTRGTVAGWGLNNVHTEGPRTLQWLDLPWIDQDQCFNETSYEAQKLIMEDKFCAGYVNQSKSVCNRDSGGGYMVLKNGRYYLRGVSSATLSSHHADPTLCKAEHYTTFTNIAYHSAWLKSEIGAPNDTLSGLPKLKCSVNADCSSLLACVDARCVNPCSSWTCGDGAECRVRNHKAKCKCRKGNVGVPLVRCEINNSAYCGKRNPSPVLLTGGQDAAIEEFPWHAGIYGLVEGSYIFICGGTLIRRNIIITAAHCVCGNDGTKVQGPEKLKVALGKVYKEYLGDDGNNRLQLLDVDSIAIPPTYQASRSFFKDDIAVMKLKSQVQITEAVNVACVDWSKSSHGVLDSTWTNTSKTVTGTVAGWGINNNNTQGPMKLQWLDLPWIEPATCFDFTVASYRPYITQDRFCAGYYEEDKSVCKGDSGSGYMVPKNRKYYLRGVVSVRLNYAGANGVCLANRFAAFTSFSFHRDWVESKLFD